MPAPPRSANTSPIQEFIYIPSDATCEAVNALVGDFNRYLSVFAAGLPPLTFTFATLPTTLPIAVEGAEVWVSDGLKIGELATGSGVYAYFSLGKWRVESTDAPVSGPANPMLDEAGGFVLDEAGGQIWSD
jgi:hypothetical protein